MSEAATPDAFARPPQELKKLLDDYERELILSALEAAGGHQRRAAAALGILPTTLCEKMKRLGLRQGHAERVPPPAREAPR